MKDYKISTEATCDLTDELIIRYQISIIDMKYFIDGDEFSALKDGVKDSRLYERMREGAKAKTTQINYDEYIEYFEDLLKDYKYIIHISFSSGLSGTYNSCLLASSDINKKYKETRIYVIDSLCACSGLGYLTCLASEFAENCDNVNDLVNYIEKTKNKVNHSFTVDDLKYLSNGGRISKGSAQIGNMLSIKPVMRMDELGKLVIKNKVIGRRKAVITLAEEVRRQYNGETKLCFISHADCESDANLLKDRLDMIMDLDIHIMDLGPVIGSHSGPGTLAVYYLGDNR